MNNGNKTLKIEQIKNFQKLIEALNEERRTPRTRNAANRRRNGRNDVSKENSFERDLQRAITGDELVNRMKKRIHQMFQDISA
ncbi:MAG: hypothetical protein LBR66_01490 [Candidatus Symbiothrix sp.]|jgi:ABC-type phosphate transport system auxiliary subunit|nr:hypothetical protein [Candidatus Symbiothrix sp.]